MALYIGDTKVKLAVGETKYQLNFYTETLITNGLRLLTSDNYILKDVDNLYITVKESE